MKIDKKILKSLLKICHNVFYPEIQIEFDQYLEFLIEKEKLCIKNEILMENSSISEMHIYLRIFMRQPILFLEKLLNYSSIFIPTSRQIGPKNLIKTYEIISTHYRDYLRLNGIISPSLVKYDKIKMYLDSKGVNKSIMKHVRDFRISHLFLLDSYFGDLITANGSFTRTTHIELVHLIVSKLVNFKHTYLDIDLLSKIVDICLNILYPNLFIDSKQMIEILVDEGYLVSENNRFECITYIHEPNSKIKRAMMIDFFFIAELTATNNHSIFEDCRSDNIRCLKRAVKIYNVISEAYSLFLMDIGILNPVNFSLEGVKKFKSFIYNLYINEYKFIHDYNISFFVSKFLKVNKIVVDNFFEKDPIENIIIQKLHSNGV